MTNVTGLSALIAEGVSPWLDGIDRRWIDSGWFASVVGHGLRGVTADRPTLLRALADSGAYQKQLAGLTELVADPGAAATALVLGDARDACDALYEVFVRSQGHDGHVSVDLPTTATQSARGAVTAALRATRSVDRPNAMVKLPANRHGLAAMRACLARGIGVHVTEVYTPGRYRQAVEAYFDGLAAAADAGLRVADIPSVVAVAVGRIDAEVDARLAELADTGADPLRGTAGLALARLLYREYEHSLGGTRWRDLQAAGARPQRLVWLTATDDDPGPHYLGRVVGWGTVTAVPRAALDVPAAGLDLRGDTLLGEHRAARSVLDGLDGLGVSFAELARELEWESGHRAALHWAELRTVVRSRVAEVAG